MAGILCFATPLLPSLLHAQESSQHHSFSLVTVREGLVQPWGFVFLPDGSILVTEKRGNLLRISAASTSRIEGVPAVATGGQGGLLDIALDPDFATNRTLYLSHSVSGSSGSGTAVSRAILQGDSLIGVQRIWEMDRKTGAGQHFGSRLRFLPDGTLLVSTGDRGDMNRAQDPFDSAGKVHRINRDGSIPPDNPFVKNKAAAASVYSLGHRNIQGLAVQPGTGKIFATEHGPQGGDELNRVRAGANYGWPVVTHGRQYGSGARIGEGTTKEGMEDSLIQWTPSIAPSGLDFYTGNAFPKWRGNLFSGNLAGTRIVRLALDGDRVIEAETLLEGRVGRIRDVREGPDGYVYFITDAQRAGLYRLEP